MSRVVPDDRHRASCMGDGPDGYYHLCRVGCAQGDGRCGGCAGWPRRRGPPTRGFREPFRDSDEAGGAAEQTRGRLSFCYEAGPCGYGLHRLLTGGGHDCVVVAPSLIPVKAGDRVKTDRRDALMLAKLHRAGELTPIWIPDAAHEAMRDLVRARATAGRVLSKARQHLQSFLLRHDQIYRGVRAWTLAYRRWLTTVRFAHPAQQIVLQDYIHAVQDAEARLDRLTRQIEELLPRWAMAPVVAALQAMRGVALVVAVTVVAEVGDFRRFANARQLMAYLGLVPSDHSSGASVRRPGITKAGNVLARRVLIEGAWTYRMPARVSRKLHDRRNNWENLRIWRDSGLQLQGTPGTLDD